MKRMLLSLSLAALVVVGIAGCSKHPTAPTATVKSNPHYRLVYDSPQVQIYMDQNIRENPEFTVGVEDSTRKTGPMKDAATWLDGTRIRYGWDSDRDFYIDFRTPRSCCYRVSYTYALDYALRLAGKPLIVYATGTNSDGSINWRIIIGASVLKYISPVADWFLFWQAKMQYYG